VSRLSVVRISAMASSGYGLRRDRTRRVEAFFMNQSEDPNVQRDAVLRATTEGPMDAFQSISTQSTPLKPYEHSRYTGSHIPHYLVRRESRHMRMQRHFKGKPRGPPEVASVQSEPSVASDPDVAQNSKTLKDDVTSLLAEIRTLGTDITSLKNDVSADQGKQQVPEENVGELPAEDDEEQMGVFKRHVLALKAMFFTWFSLLLFAFPLGILSSDYCLGWGPVPTFWLNFLALIPLAKILGDATEELDAGLDNEVLSGLLNATFGNAVEMIFTIQSLRKGMFALVKYSLLGSILSNSLLVLGCAFFFGGIIEREADAKLDDGPAPDGPPPDGAGRLGSVSEDRPLMDKSASHWHLVKEKEQSFVASGASTMVSMSMLLVSCMSWALPTVFAQALDDTAEGKATMLSVSRMTSIIMVTAYGAYLVFQLLTHRDLVQKYNEGGDDDDDDDGEFMGLSVAASVLVLFTVAMLTALSSQLLVDTIDATVADSSLTTHFIGIILLPIVGNACEHAAAVRFAVINKPGLAVSIAVGSSTQVSLLVIPFSVIMGWVLDKNMDLDFGFLNTVVLTISVLVVLSMVVNGRSNWLEGWVLCSSYIIIAVMYWQTRSTDAGDSGFMLNLSPWKSWSP